MDLAWAMALAEWTVARRARSAARTAPTYRGEFAFGTADGAPSVLGVFGDSVGCGLGTSAFESTFAARLARRLAEKGPVLCRVAAVNGARTTCLKEQAIAGDERFAVVSIGTNDATHGVPLADLERNLGAFLERLRHAELVVVAGPGDLSVVPALPHALRPYVRRLMRSYEDSLRYAAGRFPNVAHIGFSNFGGTLEPEDFAEDGFHPGDRGHLRIAEAVYRAFTLPPGQLLQAAGRAAKRA